MSVEISIKLYVVVGERITPRTRTCAPTVSTGGLRRPFVAGGVDRGTLLRDSKQSGRRDYRISVSAGKGAPPCSASYHPTYTPTGLCFRVDEDLCVSHKSHIVSYDRSQFELLVLSLPFKTKCLNPSDHGIRFVESTLRPVWDSHLWVHGPRHNVMLSVCFSGPSLNV